jgi:hypothetical protein
MSARSRQTSRSCSSSAAPAHHARCPIDSDLAADEAPRANIAGHRDGSARSCAVAVEHVSAVQFAGAALVVAAIAIMRR